MDFNIIQIEVSTICNLKCIMCPHTIFNASWISKYMDRKLYSKILDNLDGELYLHLQGWGEPLLNPHILSMIDEAIKRRFRVGLTTNGSTLNNHILEKLIPKLDLIVFSFAGICPVHENIRRGSRYNSLLDILDKVSIIRSRICGDTPKISVAYLMMRNNIMSLPDLIEDLSHVGIDEVIANNLDYIPNEKLYKMKIFSFKDGDIKPFKKIIKKAEKIAKKYGISFIARSLKCKEAAICMENPLENIFISVDGYVSPCVYLHLPTKENYITRFFEGEMYRVPKKYFGDIKTSRLADVVAYPEYRIFREVFVRRSNEEFEDIISSGFMWFRNEVKFKTLLPDVCRTCYKAYGV